MRRRENHGRTRDVVLIDIFRCRRVKKDLEVFSINLP
jgi:hypothetical protein